ncbi:MAG: hypothetical protein P4L45_11820 [Ignavibacteriaceae bacterium]|nr:hypothetical protein [Ignavibacteriaceae bacterium]
MVARLIFHSRTNIFYVIFGVLCVIAVQWKGAAKLYKFLLAGLLITSLVLEFYGLNYKQEYFLINLPDFLLLFIFLKNFILKLVNDREIDVFLIFLTFYELTLITKSYDLITSLMSGTTYFFITTLFEIFFGVFFCIYKESDVRLKIKLANPYPTV